MRCAGLEVPGGRESSPRKLDVPLREEVVVVGIVCLHLLVSHWRLEAAYTSAQTVPDHTTGKYAAVKYGKDRHRAINKTMNFENNYLLK